ncbi:hypothetical protein ACI79D_14820 [Geodermatophilus sp. SYSU D00708]
MAWWVLLLLVWAVLAMGAAVAMGMTIRTAERHDLGQGRAGDNGTDTRRDAA